MTPKLFDIEHDHEGNTFVAMNLTKEESVAKIIELMDDDVSIFNIRVVPVT